MRQGQRSGGSQEGRHQPSFPLPCISLIWLRGIPAPALSRSNVLPSSKLNDGPAAPQVYRTKSLLIQLPFIKHPLNAWVLKLTRTSTHCDMSKLLVQLQRGLAGRLTPQKPAIGVHQAPSCPTVAAGTPLSPGPSNGHGKAGLCLRRLTDSRGSQQRRRPLI